MLHTNRAAFLGTQAQSRILNKWEKLFFCVFCLPAIRPPLNHYRGNDFWPWKGLEMTAILSLSPCTRCTAPGAAAQPDLPGFFPCSPWELAPRPALARPKAPWPGHRPAGTFGGEKAREATLQLWKLNPPIGKYAGLMSLIHLLEQITFCDHPDESRKAKEDHYFHFKLTSLLIRFWLFMLLGCLCQMGTVFVYLFACLFVCLFRTWHWSMPDPFTAFLHHNVRAQASHNIMEADVDIFQPNDSRSGGAACSELAFFGSSGLWEVCLIWGESLAGIRGVDTRLQPPAINVYSDRGVYFWTMSANNSLS